MGWSPKKEEHMPYLQFSEKIKYFFVGERSQSNDKFPYGYFVTTSPQSKAPWIRGVVGDSRIGSGLMCRLMNRRVSAAKFWVGGERVWFLMDL